MPGRPQGQLERGLEELSLSMHERARVRRRGLGDTRTGEYEQQIQIDLAGYAAAAWAYADRSVAWELPLLYAPAQRRSEVTSPHFTRGFELVGNSSTLILLDAHVLSWTTTDEGWYTGARLRFAVCAPLTGNPVSYSAMAHLTFRGYGAPAEGDEFTP